MTLKEIIALKVGDTVIFQSPANPNGLLTEAKVQEKHNLCAKINF